MVWKLQVSGYSGLNESWVQKASESISNKSMAKDQLEIDDSDLPKLIGYLQQIPVRKFTVLAIEKRIVLPPSAPTDPCPTCSGTGEIRK